jgi:hemerythrin superfamily protein
MTKKILTAISLFDKHFPELIDILKQAVQVQSEGIDVSSIGLITEPSQEKTNHTKNCARQMLEETGLCDDIELFSISSPTEEKLNSIEGSMLMRLCLDEKLLGDIKACLNSSVKYIPRPFRMYLIDIIENLEPHTLANQELVESLKKPTSEVPYLRKEEKSRLLEIVEKWGNDLISKGNEAFDKYFLCNRNWNPDFLAFLKGLDYLESYSVSNVAAGTQIIGAVEKSRFLKDIGDHFQEDVEKIPFDYIQGKLKDEHSLTEISKLSGYYLRSLTEISKLSGYYIRSLTEIYELSRLSIR